MIKKIAGSPWLHAVLVLVFELAAFTVISPSRFGWFVSLLPLGIDADFLLVNYLADVANCLVAVTVFFVWRALSKRKRPRAMLRSSTFWMVAVALLISTMTVVRGVPATLIDSGTISNEIARAAMQVIGTWSAACLIAAVSDEIYARGIILTILAERGALVSVLVSSMLFGLVHIANFLRGTMAASAIGPQVVQGALFGIGAGVLKLRGGSLIWVIIVHALWNLFTDIGNTIFFMDPSQSILSSVSMSTYLFLDWLPYLLFGGFGLVVLFMTKWPDHKNIGISQVAREIAQG